MLGARVARVAPVLKELLAERDQLRAEQHRLRAEQRRLRARIKRLRPRRDLEFVFIVTYGRSGSTLLQGILNSIPGWLIRGENAGAVYHLFQHSRALTTRRQSHRRDQPLTSAAAWYGLDEYPRKRARAAIRNLVVDTLLRPEPGTRVTGFKEIRWDYDDLVPYLMFLRRTFPGARFVFNTRDHAAVAQSKWWQRAEDPRGQLEKIEDLHRTARDALGDAAFPVHYDDYVADPSALAGLFEWLGEEFDEERVAAVTQVRHSY